MKGMKASRKRAVKEFRVTKWQKHIDWQKDIDTPWATTRAKNMRFSDMAFEVGRIGCYAASKLNSISYDWKSKVKDGELLDRVNFLAAKEQL